MNGEVQVLIVDDEPQVRGFVSHVLREQGWIVAESPSAEDALERIYETGWSVVFCDVVLGGADGYKVLRHFKENLPKVKVVLMTGHGSAAGALDASAFGAYDYLLKPFTAEALQSLSQSLQEVLVNQPTHRSLPTHGIPTYQSDIDLVGRSAVFVEVMKQVGRVAATNLPVLLTGESGTGKELVASALHRRSLRADKPFLAVNCGAIAAELIESEFFGHVKGSFTSADRDRRGLLEEADGGTVLLDEITETTLAFQVKLLRALQEGEIRRVGSNQTTRIDVRVLAASNRDVEQEVAAGRFRKDLFYRLNAVSIKLPPLRERREDILPLARSFADRRLSLKKAVRFSKEALELIERYQWPGNVRELENAVVRAVALCEDTIRAQDLPECVRNHQPAETEGPNPHVGARPATEHEWPQLAEIEGRYVARVLGHTSGNKQAAARLLGVDRKTLDRMIKRHNISLDDAQKSPMRT